MKEFCVDLLQRIDAVERHSDEIQTGSQTEYASKTSGIGVETSSTGAETSGIGAETSGIGAVTSSIGAPSTEKNNNEATSVTVISTMDNLLESPSREHFTDKSSDSRPGKLSRDALLSLAVLRYFAESCLTGLDYERHLVHYNHWEGCDTYFTKYTMDRVALKTADDYRQYLKLLEAFPAQV